MDARGKPNSRTKLKRVLCNCFAIKNASTRPNLSARHQQRFAIGARSLIPERFFFFFIEKPGSSRFDGHARTHLREHQTASSRLLYRSLYASKQVSYVARNMETFTLLQLFFAAGRWRGFESYSLESRFRPIEIEVGAPTVLQARIRDNWHRSSKLPVTIIEYTGPVGASNCLPVVAISRQDTPVITRTIKSDCRWISSNPTCSLEFVSCAETRLATRLTDLIKLFVNAMGRAHVQLRY